MSAIFNARVEHNRLFNGFSMTFDNGVSVSVQFGSFNKCTPADSNGFSPNAEVAVFGGAIPNSEWLTKKVWSELFGVELNDDVAAFVSPDEVADVIAFAKSLNLNN